MLIILSDGHLKSHVNCHSCIIWDFCSDPYHCYLWLYLTVQESHIGGYRGCILVCALHYHNLCKCAFESVSKENLRESVRDFKVLMPLSLMNELFRCLSRPAFQLRGFTKKTSRDGGISVIKGERENSVG